MIRMKVGLRTLVSRLPDADQRRIAAAAERLRERLDNLTVEYIPVYNARGNLIGFRCVLRTP